MISKAAKSLSTVSWFEPPGSIADIVFVPIFGNQTNPVELSGSFAENKAVEYDDYAFEQLFKAHYKALHAYASVMLRDETVAEEIVQNMFLKLWEKRSALSIETSVKAYLYKCVYNDSLNYIKHQKIVYKYQDYTSYKMKDNYEPASDKIETTELETHLRQALNDLPQQCRTIFQMSRFEELKYREIAEQMGLSVKTVENQIGKALKILRLKLVDFLPLIIFILLQTVIHLIETA